MKKFWKGLGSAIGYTALFLGIQLWVTMLAVCFIMMNIFNQLGADVFMDLNQFAVIYMDLLLENMATIILASNLISIGVIVLILQLRGLKPLQEIQLRKTRWFNILLALVFGFGLCFTSSLIAQYLPVPEDMMEEFAAEHNTLFEGNIFMTYLSVAMVGPITEEIFFRGLNYTRLRRGMRMIWAALISATIFGLVHGNLVWFISAFLAGLGMAWIFETTGSLWASILVHMLNNFIATLTTYCPVSETVDWILTGLGLIALVVSSILLWRLNRKPAAAAPAPKAAALPWDMP